MRSNLQTKKRFVCECGALAPDEVNIQGAFDQVILGTRQGVCPLPNVQDVSCSQPDCDELDSDQKVSDVEAADQVSHPVDENHCEVAQEKPVAVFQNPRPGRTDEAGDRNGDDQSGQKRHDSASLLDVHSQYF